MEFDYYVRTIPLPVTIRGMISIDAEGFYSIYINANLSMEEQKKALAHELDHMRSGHLESDITAAEAEKEVAS